jgi:hypothetical protein
MDNKDYDSIKMVEKALPQIIRNYTPFYKYLSLANCLDANGNLTKNIHPRIKKRIDKKGTRFETKGVRNLIEIGRTGYNYTLYPDALMAHIKINGKNVDLDRLRRLIRSNIKPLQDRNLPGRGRLRRMIRIYDWLKYGP